MKRLFMVLPLFLCLVAPVQAEKEALKDYMFRGLASFELHKQERQFEQLKIRSTKPDAKDYVETTYEGNRVYSDYRYKGKKEDRTSNLEVIRNYQEVVKKLGGEILYVGREGCGDDSSFHASFKRNDKQYYMVVRSCTGADKYEVWILEPTQLKMDVEILDADTIIHKLEKVGHIALYIHFDTDKSTIKPESNDLIDEVVAALKSKPGMKTRLEGHTDNVGTAAHNKKLSDDRAKATMNAIVAKGIDKSRLSAEGYGMEKPVADNSTEEGRARNRRVEMVRL